jgi:hypothetical protein
VARRRPSRSLNEAELGGTISRFLKQADRGAALIAAAWLGDTLEQFFGSRIKVAYLFGHLEASVYQDLEVIRDIRNEFAHFREELTFQDRSIRARCQNLRTAQVFSQFGTSPLRSPRQRFLITCALLVHYLLNWISSPRAKPAWKADFDVDCHGLFVKQIAESISINVVLEALDEEQAD